MNNNEKTLFAVANTLFRQGKIKDACLIYEFLAEKSPDFPYYSRNAKIAKIKYGIDVDKKIHFNTASTFQKQIRIANLLLNHSQTELIETCLDGCESSNPEIHLAKANIYSDTNKKEWLRLLNKYLSCFYMFPLIFKNTNAKSPSNLFLNLTSENLKTINGPLVTVCMSCYNAEKYVEHAVKSILSQTYTNIELLIFDDKSTDKSLYILRQLEKDDGRIKIFDNKINQGTYVNRNFAFEISKGDYFTVLDADDFALPQRIEMQVRHLENNPDHIGISTDWIRLFINGRIQFREWLGGCYQHDAVATMMIRTQLCKQRVGYWDSVRFSADTEYQNRLYKVFGKDNLPHMKTPTVLSLFHEESLTNDKKTGINTINSGLSPTRVAYRKAWRNWHDSIDSDKLFIEFPQKVRPFTAPRNML